MLRSIQVVLLLLISCTCFLACDTEEDTRSTCTAPPFCDWDHVVSGETTAEIAWNWKKKWKDLGSVPDSFIINSTLLETLSIGHCGFRVYPGLTRQSDITSMGFVIVAIDSDMIDITTGSEKILFTDITDWDGSDSGIAGEYIKMADAKVYTENWRTYNGVCILNDVLGNGECLEDTISPSIPPEGNFGDSLQVIPLGLAFSAEEVFCNIIGEGNISNYVIYNCMYSFFPDLPGYRYDMFIRGLEGEETATGITYKIVDLIQPLVGLSESMDATRPCPLYCGDSNQQLQGDSN